MMQTKGTSDASMLRVLQGLNFVICKFDFGSNPEQNNAVGITIISIILLLPVKVIN